MRLFGDDPVFCRTGFFYSPYIGMNRSLHVISRSSMKINYIVIFESIS
ncbi:hypothetical protein BRIN106911_23920 [Brevibacillus invocatus]